MQVSEGGKFPAKGTASVRPESGAHLVCLQTSKEACGWSEVDGEARPRC